MSVDYEVEYNNRARVPEHAEIFVRWLLRLLLQRKIGRTGRR